MHVRVPTEATAQWANRDASLKAIRMLGHASIPVKWADIKTLSEATAQVPVRRFAEAATVTGTIMASPADASGPSHRDRL